MTENEAIAKFKRTSVLWESASNTEIVEAVKVAITALEEIQEYRAIGTVDECRNAVERMKPKKIVIEHIPKTSWTKEVSRFKCPCCDGIISFSGTNYCSVCGQKLDWN